MVAFAALSLSNIEAFFHTIHPHGIASWIAGVALGSILVILAALLARSETNFRDRGYITLLAVTAGLTVISGLIQGAAYAAYLPTIAAYALGLALPGFGELGLALAVAEYNAAEKRRRAAVADAGFENRINEAISDALADIDVSSAKRHIERQAAAIIRHKMDGIVADRIGDVSGNDKPAISDSTDSSRLTPIDGHQISDNPEFTNDDEARFGPENLPVANDKRQQLVAERREAILTLVSAYGPLTAADLAERLERDRGITATDRTVRSDCNALVDAGALIKNGRKWSLAPVEFSVNGTVAHA